MASESPLDCTTPVTPQTSESASLAASDDDDLHNSPSSPPDNDEHASMTAKGNSATAGAGSEAADMASAHSRPAPESSPEVNSNSVKGKAKARDGPLKLLDLPVDVLKEIIFQLPHTNDLTSLALCHSALHRLAIPCIYSRFDIVWPDESTHTEPRTGVDALTYGLATLVMGNDAFPHQARQRYSPPSSQSAHGQPRVSKTPYPVPRRRFGNYYAQFVKKFSLGNGPPAWVQEYMIAKEGGKMLGTLVALAVARMVNLETFIWDMPTGVLRDVWLALSSLDDRTDGDECRLDRLWIRWHDNTLDAPVPPPAPPMMVPMPPNAAFPSGVAAVHTPVVVPAALPSMGPSAIDRVEHPTFSVIPALKSLSVLDIDELPYLDEMSILIARSQKKLRELRVGIASHAQQRDWVTAWEGDGIQQVDYSTTSTATSTISEKRLGGVLGILVGRVHDLRQAAKSKTSRPSTTDATKRLSSSTAALKAGLFGPALDSNQGFQHERDFDVIDNADVDDGDDHQAGADAETTMANLMQPLSLVTHGQHATSGTSDPVPPTPASPLLGNGTDPVTSQHAERHDESEDSAGPVLDGKLKLEALELERVQLSVSVLLKAFDWSILTTLTLLHCYNHEQLWKSLRRTYTPRQAYPSGSPSSTKAYKASYTLRSEYSLSLKKIHTNMVSPALISFLKETLAPNTLEVLFLQEARSYSSTVTVDAIYRGPLRRHRASLKKVMIDSSEHGPDAHASSTKWRRWMLTRDIITFITSGRMSSLRELAVSIDYKDWHHFLQRLPMVPHIRSLYIPYIADHAHGNNIDPRELAMQILDIVHLRPEIEICYMAISTKCFEILENRPSNYDIHPTGAHDTDGANNGAGAAYAPHDPMLSDDDSEASVTEDEDDDDFETSAVVGAEDSSSDMSDDAHDDSDDDSFLQEDPKKPQLRIREILFYEEKIETLRARHGTLKP